MPLRRYSGETIPKGLNRDEVIRLLATTEGDRPADIRDRAILMLLITYGLRAGEVRGLQTEDMHSRENMLRVRRPKPGRTHLYPLSQGVRETVTRYLSEVRPEHHGQKDISDTECAVQASQRQGSGSRLSETASIVSASLASIAARMHCVMRRLSTFSTTACR